MFQKLKGFKYYAFEGADLGIIWIEPATCIALKDNETDIYNSYYLSANITINTGIASTIEAKILEYSETEYKVTTEEQQKFLKVERLAKKNEGLIQDLVQETSEHEEKISQVEQTVDSIRQNVGDIIDYKREINGITQIHLTDATKTDVLKLEVKGNKTYEDNLYPQDNLFPCEIYPNEVMV